MIGIAPKFIDSPFFVSEPGNWHLKPGAPKEVVREFNEFMRQIKQLEAPYVTVEEILKLLESGQGL